MEHTEAALSNVSRKEIVLAIVHFDGNGNKSGVAPYDYIMDRFFGPALRIGGSEKIEGSLPFGWRMASGEPMPAEGGRYTHPKSTANVVFVQFADGASWGDPEAARNAFFDRKITVEELNRLAQVHNTQGKEAFVREISKSAASLQFDVIRTLVSGCKQRADSCLIGGLHSALQAATEHQAVMTDTLHVSAPGTEK